MRDPMLFPFMSLEEAVAHSIALLREHASDRPYWGGFSGGKDSVVLKHLCHEAGVAVEWHYQVTTIEPTEALRFIHDVHPDVRLLRHPEFRNFADYIAREGLPTISRRSCCKYYKERESPRDRILLLGIRAEESPRRARIWREWNPTWRTGPRLCPILYWTEADVWEYIESHKLPYCRLYDEGYSRIGCIGCPMQSTAQRRRDLARWPHVARLIRDGIARRREYVISTPGGADTIWGKSIDEIYEWWLSGQSVKAWLESDEEDGLFSE